MPTLNHSPVFAIILAISGVVSIAVALITLGWIFRDADDSDRSLQNYLIWSRFLPWWTSKFGIWLGISTGSGYLTFRLLCLGWQRLAPHP
jgi:hypothetical protein